MWNPDRYLTYADERSRPFVELLARIDVDDPARVVDLGCGPGNLTRLLKDRWPDAEVIGVDASPEMLAKARAIEGIEWREHDVREFDEEADVIVSNATLQWVPDHLDLLPRLAAQAQWLAFQVPGNHGEPSHVLREELAAEEPFRSHTRHLDYPGGHDAATYLDLLGGDAWETTYLHLLEGEDAVFDWVSGSSAQPTLNALPAHLRERFAAELKARLRVAYPAKEGRVTLPFRRVFLVTHQ